MTKDVNPKHLNDEPEIRFRLLLKKWLERMVLEVDRTPNLDGRGGDLLATEWSAVQALGPERAEAVRQEEYRIFYAETGRCPTCGEQGPVPPVALDHPHHQPRVRLVIEKPAVVAAPPVPMPSQHPARTCRGIGRQSRKIVA